MIRRWARNIPMLSLVGLLTAGLVGLGAAPAASAATAPSSITLLYGIQAQDNWWFPDWTANYCGSEASIFNMAYRPLLWLSNNGTIDYPQSIASGITVSNHDTVFTVHMGTRFKWSNGQTVNAYDALYDAQVVLAAANPKAPWTDCGVGVGGLPADWKSVTAPNARTLVVTTTKPVNPVWFEENGIMQIVPIPKSVWDHSANWTTELKWIASVGVNSAAPQFKVVDGPYAYGAFERDSYETLVANPHYTGPNPARIKKITYLYETSESNLLAASLRGTFAMLGALPAQYVSELPILKRQAGYDPVTLPQALGFDYAVPNLNNQDPVASLLKQLYIRQALELAINQRGMLRLAGNKGSEDYGPIPESPRTTFYDPAETKAGYPFNPSRGKALLESHGWKMHHGVMTQNGKTLTFTLVYQSGSEWVTDAAELWQSTLKQEGIVLKLQPSAEAGTIAFTTHKWELVWFSGGGDAWTYQPDYYPTGVGLFVPGGTVNAGDFNNAHLTQLAEATHAPGTPAVERQRMDAYEVYAAKMLPVLYMPTPAQVGIIQPWLHLTNQGTNVMLEWYPLNFWYTTPR